MNQPLSRQNDGLLSVPVLALSPLFWMMRGIAGKPFLLPTPPL
jgi:hypothetical protein